MSEILRSFSYILIFTLTTITYSATYSRVRSELTPGHSFKCENPNEESCKKDFKNKLKKLLIKREFNRNYHDSMLVNFQQAKLKSELVSYLKKQIKDTPFLTQKISKALSVESIEAQAGIDFRNNTISQQDFFDYTYKTLSSVIDQAESISNDKKTKILVGAKKIAEGAFQNYPGISIGNYDSAAKNEELKNKTYEYLDEVVLPALDSDPENYEILGNAIVGYFGHTLNYEGKSLTNDPTAQSLIVVDDLFEIQDGKIKLNLENSNKLISDQITSQARSMEKNIKNTKDSLDQAIKDIDTQNSVLIDKTNGIIKKTTKIANDTDYLTTKEIAKDIDARINESSISELDTMIRDIKRLPENCGSSFSDGSLNFKKCQFQKQNLKKAENRKVNLQEFHAMNLAQSSLTVIGDLGVIFKDKNLQKFANDGQKVLKTFQQVQKAIELAEKAQMAGDLLTSMSSMMTGVGAITTAISLFMDSGPSIDEIMLGMLQDILKNLETLKKEMHERFDSVDAKLKQLSNNIGSSFYYQNRILFDHISNVNNQIKKGNQSILDRLNDLSSLEHDILQNRYDSVTLAYNEMTSNFETLSSSPDDISQSIKEIANKVRAYLQTKISMEKSLNFIPDQSFDNNSIFASHPDLALQIEPTHKLSNLAQAKFLSFLKKLDISSNSCNKDYFSDLLMAQFLLDDFVKLLQSYEMSNYLEIINGWGNEVNPDLLKSIDLLISEVEKSIQTVKTCLKGSNPNENLIVDNFVVLYKKLISEAVQSVPEMSETSKELDSFLNHIKADETFRGMSDQVYNGKKVFDVFHDKTSRDKFDPTSIIQAKNWKEFTSKEFISQQFKNKKWTSIEHCANRGEPRAFPAGLIENLITSMPLKLSLITNSVNWNFCYYDNPTLLKTRNDDGEFNFETLIKAERTVLDSEDIKTNEWVTVWKLKIKNIPEEFIENVQLPPVIKQTERVKGVRRTNVELKRHGKATIDFEQMSITDMPEFIVSEVLSEGINNQEAVEEKDCKEGRSVYKVTSDKRVSRMNIHDQLMARDAVDAFSATTSTSHTEWDELIGEFDIVSCIKNNKISRKLLINKFWQDYFVETNKAYSVAKDNNINCVNHKRIPIKVCSYGNYYEHTETEYNKRKQNYFNNPSYNQLSSLGSGYFTPDLEEGEERKEFNVEIYDYFVSAGLKRVFEFIQTAKASCYFAALKGSSYCQAYNLSESGQMELPISVPISSDMKSTYDMSNLSQAHRILINLPLSILRPRADRQTKTVQIMAYMNELPTHLPNLWELILQAETMNQLQANNLSSKEIVDEVLKDHFEQIDKNYLKYLKENTEIDPSIGIDREVYNQILIFRDKLQQEQFVK